MGLPGTAPKRVKCEYDLCLFVRRRPHHSIFGFLRFLPKRPCSINLNLRVYVPSVRIAPAGPIAPYPRRTRSSRSEIRSPFNLAVGTNIVAAEIVNTPDAVGKGGKRREAFRVLHACHTAIVRFVDARDDRCVIYNTDVGASVRDGFTAVGCRNYILFTARKVELDRQLRLDGDCECVRRHSVDFNRCTYQTRSRC